MLASGSRTTDIRITGGTNFPSEFQQRQYSSLRACRGLLNWKTKDLIGKCCPYKRLLYHGRLGMERPFIAVSALELLNRLSKWFPDREFFMRAEGQVRFVKLSSKLQIRVAAGAAALTALWLVALAVMALRQYRAEADLASFAEQKVRVATAEERLKAYGGNLEKVVEDLRQRQDFLEKVTRMLPDDMASEDDAPGTVTDSSTVANETVRKVGSLIPQAKGLAEIEARQLALVERLTRFADARSRRTEVAIRKLNLDPKSMSRQTQTAVGGPFNAITGEHGIDPRFERLGLSLTRMAVLERALIGIPQVAPAGVEGITSGFGYRRDPFNGLGAMHSGIDFKGASGSPIFAAADGRVTFAGWKAAYGNAIEITHGNGILTRYAHLSRIGVKIGQLVEAGATIGGLGSSGRSTGPHLHFEVRINDRAVNPRPFLEIAPDVLKEVRRSGSEQSIRAASR